MTFHDKNEREYCAIPKEYFKEIKPCYAKWETHKSSKEYPVSMWSGACFTTNRGCGYIYVDFGKTDDGEPDQRWVSAVQVNECTSRASKPVDRYSPCGKNDVQRSVTNSSIFQGGNWRGGATHDEIVLYYEYFKSKDLCNDVYNIATLFYLADRKWMVAKAKELEQKKRVKDGAMPNIAPVASPKSPLMVTSLTYDIIRGKKEGSLGKELDEKLGVCHHVGIPYVEAITNMVRNLQLEENVRY